MKNRRYNTVDYQATLDVTIRLGDCLPPDHLARFVVDAVAHLDLSTTYARYGSRGGEPYAPEVLLGLLFYSYATGVFASRKIERATYELAPLPCGTYLAEIAKHQFLLGEVDDHNA